jgi:O-succinylbenzoic acid--CoA ligase
LAEDAVPLATIVLSSGTTSQPKAVAHDLEAHLANAAGANQNLPLRTDDRWLLSLPWAHVSGLGILFRCALAGATAVLPVKSSRLDEDLPQREITHVSLVPTQLKRLLGERQAPPAALQVCLLGGGPLPTKLIGQAGKMGWPISTTYGLTEMASQVTTTPPEAGETELQTAGRPLSGRSVRISPEGEILVRGKTLFRGYCQHRRLHRPLDDAGWFHTGDRGRIDDQDCLTVAGRVDHMFISGGENIHPEEIERALLDLDGVLRAIVVPVSDEEFGQRPVAFVDALEIRSSEWSARLAEQLPRFKVPDRFFAWPKRGNAPGIKPGRRHFQTLAAQQLGRS